MAEANEPVEVIFVNVENGKTEKLTVTPEDGKIGIATEPVTLE